MSFFDSALNSATNAVNTVKNTLSESGPASSLSALGSSITGALSGALGSVAGGIGNILSAVGTGTVQSDKKLPMPNVLHDYASYDYVITMGCLSAQEFNFPNESYMAGQYPPIILKSANASPNSHTNTYANSHTNSDTNAHN